MNKILASGKLSDAVFTKFADDKATHQGFLGASPDDEFAEVYCESVTGNGANVQWCLEAETATVIHGNDYIEITCSGEHDIVSYSRTYDAPRIGLAILETLKAPLTKLQLDTLGFVKIV